MTGAPLTALSIGAAGVVGTVGGWVAQTAVPAASEVTPWISGGGVATLAGVLLYLFKQFLSGNLVSRPMAEVLRGAEVVSAASMEREDALQRALEDARRREDGYVKKIEDANRMLFRASEALKAAQQR